MNIPITKPPLGEEEMAAIVEPLKTGWVVQGPYVAAFEKQVAQFSGVTHGIATTSCTTALHLALLIAGIGEGDEVILPAFTYIATANAIRYTGATPIFADIELSTFNLDPDDIEHRITEKTKAIVPVHLFGLIADMQRIGEIAETHGLLLIEDAACAIGARKDNRHAGDFSLGACLSFHPRKVITTGEGGMLLTNDDTVAKKARMLRDHGQSIGDLSRHEGKAALLPDFPVVGYNYRMTDMQGAMGVEQMKKLSWILDRRRALAGAYDEALKAHPELAAPIVPDGYEHSYQAYVALFGGGEAGFDKLDQCHAERNAFMEALAKKGIQTRQGTHAVHLLEYYRKTYKLAAEDFPKATLADKLSIALPLFPTMTDEEFDYIIAKLTETLESKRGA